MESCVLIIAHVFVKRIIFFIMVVQTLFENFIVFCTHNDYMDSIISRLELNILR